MDQILPYVTQTKLHTYIVTFQFKNIFKRYFTKLYTIFRVSVYISTQYKACSYHFPLDVLKPLFAFIMSLYHTCTKQLYITEIYYTLYISGFLLDIQLSVFCIVISQTLVNGRKCITQKFLLYVVHIDETASCIPSSCDENPST